MATLAVEQAECHESLPGRAVQVRYLHSLFRSCDGELYCRQRESLFPNGGICAVAVLSSQNSKEFRHGINALVTYSTTQDLREERKHLRRRASLERRAERESDSIYGDVSTSRQ